MDDASVRTTRYGLFAILGFGGLLLVAALFSTYYFKGKDPVDFVAVFFFLVETWDFFSDLIFALSLLFNNHFRLFLASITFVALPYCINMVWFDSLLWGGSFLCVFFRQAYLIRQLRRWKATATGDFKIWLEYNEWFLLGLAMVAGGAQPAVELANSLLCPIDLFYMRLHFQEVRAMRTNRFLTTILFEVCLVRTTSP